MAENDITITVDADNRTTAAFGAAARGARTVGEATENANRALREAANRSEAAALRLRQLAFAQQAAAERAQRHAREAHELRTAMATAGVATAEQTRRLTQLTRQQEQAATSARLLANQHRQSAEQVRDLAAAYRRAENNAQQALRASLMFGAGARLGPDGTVSAGGSGRDDGPGALRRLFSMLPGLGGLAATGAGAAGSATSNPLVGTGVLAAGAAAAALLAPLLGGAITGAVVGAGGLGGVGLGVAGAIANDPKAFEQQWSGVADRVRARWLAGSREWVQPAHDALREVDGMLRRLPIENVLRNSAAYLAPLTKGVTGFGEGIFVGLDRLVERAGPVIDMLSKRLPKLGADIGQMFAALGEGSEGGAVALDDLLYVLGRMTKGLGVTLGALGRMYQGVHQNIAGFIELGGASADWVANLLDGIPVLDRVSEKIKEFRSSGAPAETSARRLPGAPPVIKQDTSEIERVPSVFRDATTAVDEYIAKLGELRDATMGAKSAEIALAQGWLDLDKELRDGKRTLDLNTQAGIDNQRALLDQIAAAEAARQQYVALTGDLEGGNAAYEANIERIRRMAKALGFNDQQVDALIESLRVLDTTKAKPEVELEGTSKALADGYSLGNLLNRIERTYYPKVQVVYGPGISLGNALHHAVGGPTSPGMSVINEWGGQSARQGGGEVVSLPTGSMVYGGAAARGGDGAAAGGGMSARDGQGGGGAALLGSDGTRWGDLMVETIAAAVRAKGGRPELLGIKTDKTGR